MAWDRDAEDPDEEKTFRAAEVTERLRRRVELGSITPACLFEDDVKPARGASPGHPLTPNDDYWQTIHEKELLQLIQSYLQDSAVYASLHAGQVQQAMDQLVQNMNFKQQDARDAGSLGVASHLAGPTDRTPRPADLCGGSRAGKGRGGDAGGAGR